MTQVEIPGFSINRIPSMRHSEEQVVAGTGPLPVTVSSLISDFQGLGIQSGMTLLVHSSLSSLGWVCGAAVAVILSLERTLGEKGTLVMPAFSGGLSEPSQWHCPSVPENWWEIIRRETPAYDSNFTPTRGVGVVAETFRKQPGVIRSFHPQVSFAARGRFAKQICLNHSLDFALGDNSPLGRIYELDGHVLLLGVGYSNNTSFHLAEFRADYPSKKTETFGAPLTLNDERVWLPLTDYNSDDSDFEAIGSVFEAQHPGDVRTGKIGNSTARLLRQRPLVDHAVAWISSNRK